MSELLFVSLVLSGIIVILGIAVVQRLEHIAKALDRIDERGGVL